MSILSYVQINWVLPTVSAGTYDTVNIYRSGNEASGYSKIGTVAWPATSYTDTSKAIASKDSVSYVVTFSLSTVPGVESDYVLTYKTLSPREKRIIFQLRDSLSRFITNRLADEEIRQYLDQGIGMFNARPPATEFDIFTLPKTMEPLVLYGSLIAGVSNNMLGIGFTDVSYTDNGWQLSGNRMDKMNSTLDKVLKIYDDLIRPAKLEFAYGGDAIGTVSLPIGIGGRVGNVLGLFDMLSSLGR